MPRPRLAREGGDGELRVDGSLVGRLLPAPSFLLSPPYHLMLMMVSTVLEAWKACGTGIRCLVGESSTSLLGRGPHLQAQVAEDL